MSEHDDPRRRAAAALEVVALGTGAAADVALGDRDRCVVVAVHVLPGDVLAADVVEDAAHVPPTTGSMIGIRPGTRVSRR